MHQSRLIGVFGLALVMVLAACSSSDEGASSTTESSPTDGRTSGIATSVTPGTSATSETTPPATTLCPPGTTATEDGSCILPPCPEGELRNNAGECVQPPLQCPDGFSVGEEGCEPPPCPTGFERQDANCVDIDECADPALNDCDDNATCRNTAGAWECTCTAGYAGDGTSCTPDCASPCGDNATCAVEGGEANCICDAGWVLGRFGECVDVDECADPALNDCDPFAVCDNTPGSYTCTCPEDFEGDGTSCTPVCDSACGENEVCTFFEDGNACDCATGFEREFEETSDDEPVPGACVDIDECETPRTVTIRSLESRPKQDCITPNVCLARGNTLPLYNSALEIGPVQYLNDTVLPSGTLWATGRCDEVVDEDFSYMGAASSRTGTSIRNRDLCMMIVETEARYDIHFETWRSGGNSDDEVFRYRRTAVHTCGVADATCTNTLGFYDCDCPENMFFDESRGECMWEDACADEPCGEGAVCFTWRGEAECRCELTQVGPFGDTPVEARFDCLDESVCLTRDEERGIYNDLQETAYDDDGSRCNHPSPLGVSVASGSCASVAAAEEEAAEAAATDEEPESLFGNWNSALTQCRPPAMVGDRFCVEVDASGDRWDFAGLYWQSDGRGGDFSYQRWRTVETGVSCF